jgi:hypothetical protein
LAVETAEKPKKSRAKPKAVRDGRGSLTRKEFTRGTAEKTTDFMAIKAGCR